MSAIETESESAEETHSSTSLTQPHDLSSLQENFSQQQAKISALKELVRQSEADQGKNTASAQEKVRNIAQRLNHLKTKASRSRQGSTTTLSDKTFTEIQEEYVVETHTTVVSGQYEHQGSHFDSAGQSFSSSVSVPTTPLPQRARSETPGSEKIQLLRQQMEQNRQKMAERETNKRGIEQLVTQLKAKFDSSQLSLDRAHQLGSSVGDLSSLSGSVPHKHQSTGDLSVAFNLDRERIKYLEKRVRHLETEMKRKEEEFLTRDPESEHLKTIKTLEQKICDLEESLKVKDDVIQARTQAASLITESLSLKGKSTVDLLEETKQEMFKMQTAFVHVEDEMKAEIDRLHKECQVKDKKIANLEEVNDILETARFDLTMKNSELDGKSGDAEEYLSKINELNKINETLQQRIETLENNESQSDVAIVAQATVEQVKKVQELELQIAEIQKENDDLKRSLQNAVNVTTTDEDIQDKIRSLEATIAAQRDDCAEHSKTIQDLQEQLTEKTVEYNVLLASFNVLEEKLKSYAPKSLFSKSTDEEAQAEINKLTKQLDEANKLGIKTKLKMKQLQKQVDTFKKSSDTNRELIKQAEEIQRLTDRIKELESEKLAFVSATEGQSDTNKTVQPTELEARVKILETTCQNQTSAIQLLEEQKLDMTADLNSTKTELSSLKGHIKDIDKQEVTSEMDSIAFEEKIDSYQREVDSLKDKIGHLSDEKTQLNAKLERYINENMELLDKIEKLSKGSSAESIEILERLTQQEKLEMEQYHHALEMRQKQNRSQQSSVIEGEDDRHYASSIPSDDIDDANATAFHHSPDDNEGEPISQNLSDSLVKLREESSELMHKIELFTAERREVLAKLEALREENAHYSKVIEELHAQREHLKSDCEDLKTENLSTIKQLKEAEDERQHLLDNIKEISDIKAKLEENIDALTKAKDEASKHQQHHVSRPWVNQETYGNGLKSLEAELTNYRNAKDKNSKFNVSKKLAKEAKNISELVRQLLDDYERSTESFVSLQAEVEGARQAREEHDNAKIKEMADIPLRDNREMENELEKYRTIESELKKRCDDLQRQIEDEKQEKDKLKRSLDESVEKVAGIDSLLKAENEHLTEQIRELESKLTETNEFNFQELHKQRKEFDNLLATSKKEIDILRELVEEQKQQLISAYTEHEDEIQEKAKQIADYGEQIKSLQTELDETNALMSNANDQYMSELSKKIESMRTLLDENQKILDDQTKELANKQDTIETLNQQIMDLYGTLENQAAEMNEKDDEINQLQHVVDQNKAEIKKLHEKCQAIEHQSRALLQKKEEETNTIRSDLETKNKEQLEKLKKFAANLKKRNAQFTELEEKYRELEKSKAVQGEIIQKTADEPPQTQKENISLQQSSNKELDHLKKTTIDLEDKLRHSDSENQNLQVEINHRNSELENLKLRLTEKVTVVDQLTSELAQKEKEILDVYGKLGETEFIRAELLTTANDLKAKNIKIEKCKAVIKEKNREIKRLQELVENVGKAKAEDPSTTSSIADELNGLRAEKIEIENNFASYTSSIEAKLQENALFIETIETENNQLKERIGRLEESISIAEERRSSLERHSELLGLQLEQKQSQIENAEDEFTRRMEALVSQDEIIEKKLIDLENEKDALLVNLKETKDELNEAKRQHNILQCHVNELESTKLFDLENDNKTLKERIQRLEKQLSEHKEESDQMISAKQAELLELENELSIVMQKVEKERRSIQEDLEKSRDENSILQDEIVRLREAHSGLEQTRSELEQEITWIKLQNDSMTHDQAENQELRMQVVEDQTEVDNLRVQNQELVENHARELKHLQEQLSEATEMKDKLLVANREVEKLQFEIHTLREQHVNELDALRSQICRDQTEIVSLRLTCEQQVTDHETELNTLRQRVCELSSIQQQANQNHNQDQLVQQLRTQMAHDHQEIESLRIQKQQLDNELSILRQQINELDSLQMHVGQNVTQDQLEVQQLRTQINHDQLEIESLRHQLQQVNSNRENELAGLRQQISELDSLRMQVGQNQTDDQVFIQNENERLQALLAEKEIEIQNYQRQNLQLQMSANVETATSNTVHDPFAAIANNPFSVSTETPDIASLHVKIADLENQISNLLREISEKQHKINDLESNLVSHSNGDLHVRLTELQRLCNEKDAEIARLHEQTPTQTAQTEPPVFNVESYATLQHLPHSNAPAPPSSLSSFFDNPHPSEQLDINVLPVSVEHHDQQIEDLQRNVSDLEKYVTDLEHKLKSSIEENIKYQNERLSLENNLGAKIKQYEEKIAVLENELQKVNEKLAQNEAERLVVQSHADVVTPRTGFEQPLNTASIFFGPAIENDPFDQVISSDQSDSDRKAVMEEIIVPKKAYIVHPNEEQLEALDRQNLSPFSANQSEGWGDNSWGADAALEEEHQRSVIPPVGSQPLDVHNRDELMKLQLQIDDLGTEKNNLKEELTTLHTKYQKMLRKLREYKARNDEFENTKKPSAFETNDLDLAIQEELNSRIKTLEQCVKETKADLEKETLEKKKLLNRIDVLTAANERMCEMKEKQDVEVEMCKTKIRELTNKLQTLNEWRDDDDSAPKNPNTDALTAQLVEAQNQNRMLEDRLARLQDAVTDKDEFEEEREQLLEKIRVLSEEKRLLDESIGEKDREITQLKSEITNLQTQSTDYSSTIDLLSGESNNIKVYLDQLKNENNNLSEKVKELDDKNNELSKQLEEMRRYNLNTQDVEQRIQDLIASNQYKDSEIGMLNERLEGEKVEVEREWTRLNQELENKNEFIINLENAIGKLTAERDVLLQNTSQPVAADQSSCSNGSLVEMQKEIAELKEEKESMEKELQVLNDQVLKNLEIEDRIKSTVLELDMKNIEISELKSSLDHLRANQSQITDSNSADLTHKIKLLEQALLDKNKLYEANISELNQNWQQTLDERCHELADSWREHYNRRQEEFDLIESDLKHQLSNLRNQLAQGNANVQGEPAFSISDKTPQQKMKPSGSNDLSVGAEERDDEQSTLIAQMQAALESQEIEIVSLKEQLAIRSAEYARLAASVDPYGQRSTSSSFHSLQTEKTSGTQAKGNELDLALYMLHQRDMRCEELTEEVIHLLEERDTLQLKLSNSIRRIEDLKQRLGTSDLAPSEVESNSSESPTKPIAEVVESAIPSPSTEHTKNSDPNNLNIKLSELHTLGHSRDKRVYEERDQRRRQMSLFQRDVANMPPEAIAELFGPNYNPSAHSAQNPSSMLLNWLWGKGSTNEPDN